MTRTIDLNLDAGELPQRLKDGSEARLYDLVSSVNIACGGHAGDENTMRAAVRLAKARGLAIGAHPSYVDRENFGRALLVVDFETLVASLKGQIEMLARVCRDENVRLTHVKPHGALYNVAAGTEEVALALIRAVRAVDPDLAIMELAGSKFAEWCVREGVRFVGEAFVDRRYEPDGRLRARSLPQALIEESSEVAQQALTLVLEGKARTCDGGSVAVEVGTLCLHGDSPAALENARAVRVALEEAGVQIRRYDEVSER